jgi:hypothetical protein
MLLMMLTASLVVVLAACGSTDVVAKTAIRSFEAVTTELGDAVASDEALDAWAINLPSGERFFLGKAFEGNLDTAIELDAAPFIAAGLKPESLNEEVYRYDAASGRLMVVGEFGSKALSGQTGKDIAGTFSQLVETYRSAIGYHEALDHYGIDMGSGNMFEWAKDMTTNDKDLVLVLNPEPLIKAGVDPAKVTKWIFAAVETMDKDGKKITVDKFLMPFDLK